MAVAFFVLKERVKRFEVIMIILTVACILIIVIGGTSGNGDSDEADSNTASKTVTMIMYGVLLVNPFLSAAGTISMRKMKKFHEAVVSWYLNWGIGLVSIAVLLIMR